ncbi:hypothetical protein SMICM17S_07174 [Streptomyces microflavus]
MSGELPPISRKIPVGEYERIKRRNIDTQNAEIRDAMLDDGVRLARQIEARMELARGEAIFNASVVLNENGVQASVDFGRAAGHTVTAGTVWSNVSADITATSRRGWRSTTTLTAVTRTRCSSPAPSGPL